MLVHIKEILNNAHKHGYAIGAFNTSNLEMTLGIIRAAVAKKAPVIVQISETSIRYGGLMPLTNIVHEIAKSEAVNIPVALHLDHGRSFRTVAQCIKAGFTSIMIDQSELPFDENVTLSKQAVEYAHKREVWAQGELGSLLGEEDLEKLPKDKEYMTDPEQAKDFVAKTGVDTLAVSIGNIHGIIKMKLVKPNLDLDRLAEIHKLTKIPLVLHGASGLGEGDISQVIERGVNIVNIDTELRLTFTNALRDTLRQNPEMYDPRKVLSPVIDATQKMVENKLEIFGSSGRG